MLFKCFFSIFSEIILKSTHWPWRRGRFMGFSIFSSGGHSNQQSGTILAILVEGHPRTICVKLFLKSAHLPRRRCCLKFFFLFFTLTAILFSPAETF